MRRLSMFFLVLLAAFLSPGLALAQPELIEASPMPNATLDHFPTQVRITFDRALQSEGTWLRVTNSDGEPFSVDNAYIEAENRRVLTAQLAPLREGVYVVTYNAVAVGGSTVTVGRYEFIVNLPDPSYRLLEPQNGAAFNTGDIPLHFEFHFFDFERFNNHVNLYVDGDLVAELRNTEYVLEDLSPGVHEIRTVLARFENEEIPETEKTIYVAVAQPDQELIGRQLAAVASPDPGLQLTSTEWLLIIVATLFLLGAGFFVGYRTRPDLYD